MPYQTKNKRPGLTAIIIGIVIVGIIVAAIALQDADRTQRAKDILQEGLGERISFEITSRNMDRAHTQSFTNNESEPLESVEYMVRVSHEKDVTMHYSITSKNEDEIPNGLILKITNETTGEVVTDNNVKNTLEKEFTVFCKKNAAGKNDTNFKYELYADPNATGAVKYDKVELTTKWWVDKADKDNMMTSRSGDVSVIIIAFLIGIIIMAIIFIFFRDKINPEVFMTPEEIARNREEELEESKKLK